MITTPFAIIIFIIVVIGILMWVSRDAKNLDACVSLDQEGPVAPYKIEQPSLTEAITEVAVAVQAVADSKASDAVVETEEAVKPVVEKKTRKSKANIEAEEKPKRKPRAKKA